MSQQGRPPRGESLRRKAMFLSLVASGVDVLQAAKDAHVKPERALKIISTADEFQAAVAAIRAGAGPLAVVVAEPKAQAA